MHTCRKNGWKVLHRNNVTTGNCSSESFIQSFSGRIMRSYFVRRICETVSQEESEELSHRKHVGTENFRLKYLWNNSAERCVEVLG